MCARKLEVKIKSEAVRSIVESELFKIQKLSSQSQRPLISVPTFTSDHPD